MLLKVNKPVIKLRRGVGLSCLIMMKILRLSYHFIVVLKSRGDGIGKIQYVKKDIKVKYTYYPILR